MTITSLYLARHPLAVILSTYSNMTEISVDTQRYSRNTDIHVKYFRLCRLT